MDDNHADLGWLRVSWFHRRHLAMFGEILIFTARAMWVLLVPRALERHERGLGQGDSGGGCEKCEKQLLQVALEVADTLYGTCWLDVDSYFFFFKIGLVAQADLILIWLRSPGWSWTCDDPPASVS